MRRLTFAAASATLALAALTGCGGGDGNDSASKTETYCKDVEAAGKKLSDIASAADLEGVMGSLKKVRDEAPGSVKEDWSTLIKGYESAQSGDVASLDQEALQKAGEKIDKQVKADCDLDMDKLS
ncbi:hypothetical protein [Mumia zhuanghuii]|uniref:Lipoprotein n=1 Tax=Mumia zhuanghuii TaxID=2585211 RepID=A0A5C4MLN6_9ACTN|nr:hypothetical protein [Mumia zhuanghuii]TNC44140.1 hypothetical protein FHE65_17310 [Mumia zhuanghuii]TNC47919.1 hypothetical protein FHE65_08375 [Mumia zhuanghuii]